jgi:hypothetical protein
LWRLGFQTCTLLDAFLEIWIPGRKKTPKIGRSVKGDGNEVSARACLLPGCREAPPPTQIAQKKSDSGRGSKPHAETLGDSTQTRREQHSSRNGLTPAGRSSDVQ